MINPPATFPRFDLPKIQVPKFNGEFESWQNFWGIFENLIHSRVDISNMVKFHYLLTCLQDELKELIKGLQVTDANYLAAFQMLQLRFDDPNKVKQILIHRFNNLPNPHHNLADLKNFVTKVNQLYLQIGSHSVNFDADEFIKSLLVQKLHRQTFESIVQHTRKLDFTLGELLDSITFINDTSEYTQLMSGGSVPVKQVVDKPHNKFKLSCPLCNNDHKIDFCNKFKTRDAKREQMVKLKLCFNCFSNKHISKDCLSKQSRKICRGRHHTVICYKSQPQSPPISKPVGSIPAKPSGR